MSIIETTTSITILITSNNIVYGFSFTAEIDCVTAPGILEGTKITYGQCLAFKVIRSIAIRILGARNPIYLLGSRLCIIRGLDGLDKTARKTCFTFSTTASISLNCCVTLNLTPKIERVVGRVKFREGTGRSFILADLEIRKALLVAEGGFWQTITRCLSEINAPTIWAFAVVKARRQTS